MSTYYNENDPYAAEWLRNLITEGLIAPGDVDDRSIEDVTGDNVRGYTQCHWFAGVGGWSYALRLAGWLDTREVWTGSCPCQPFSAAGQRRGTDDPRHLWPHMRRLIGECRPRVCFGEQVASAAGREWLAGVHADLEALAFAVGAADLCAAGCGAPHIRQRLWWVAESGGGLLRAGESWTNERGLQAAHGNVFGEGNAQSVGRRDGGLADAEDPDRWCGECREEAGVGAGGEWRRGSASGGIDGRLGENPWGATWLPCADGKARRVEPGTPPLAHGLPRSVAEVRAGAPGVDDPAGLLRAARAYRKGTLKGMGNGIVPQVAALFVGAYMDAKPRQEKLL